MGASCSVGSHTKSGERYPRDNLVRAGGLCLCSSDFNRLLFNRLLLHGVIKADLVSAQNLLGNKAFSGTLSAYYSPNQ